MLSSLRLKVAIPLGFLSCLSAISQGLTSSSDSALGMLETQPPTIGSLTTPPVYTGSTPMVITYADMDDSGSGFGFLEIWIRSDVMPWMYADMMGSTTAGTFPFPTLPTGHTYYFDIVAEDALGNRSPEPSGMIGTGLSQTLVTTESSVVEWSVLE